jgi:predicted nucleotidyltransferase component of viral defense system
VLKGGTALNLFALDIPRLSVDIDLNYIGAVDRATMIAERPKVEQAIQAVCARQRLQVKRVPGEHAGGKWRLTHERSSGGTGTLELDINFLARIPLWPPSTRDSRALGPVMARDILVLDPHELTAGKLAALFSRDASRDLFDVHALLTKGGFDRQRLRLAFVSYGAMSRRDWRTVSVADIHMDATDADRRLVPLLRAGFAPARRDIEAWSARLVTECRNGLSLLLPLEAQEIEFLDLINDRGEIAPDLLTADSAMQDRIRAHPALLWKALNARKRAGLTVSVAGEGAGLNDDEVTTSWP